MSLAPTERVEQIERRLNAAFSPESLLVKNQSHLHAGHAGAQAGLGHFDVNIVSDAFAGLSRIAAHKLIYEALGEMMTTDIHALRISASAKPRQ